MENTLPNVDTTWTLFLDRDGVINHEKKEDYILNWNEFVFYDGVKEAMKIFSNLFGTIVMVTNQRGIGKGLMTENDLQNIHLNMVKEIKNEGGRVDKIYYCTDLDNTSIYRKPNAGMAFQAKKELIDIDFSKAIMVGNKLSDMGFGRNAAMQTVFLATTNPETAYPHASIDFRFNSLLEFAKNIEQKKH